jgi:hypothetical protein
VEERPIKKGRSANDAPCWGCLIAELDKQEEQRVEEMGGRMGIRQEQIRKVYEIQGPHTTEEEAALNRMEDQQREEKKVEKKARKAYFEERHGLQNKIKEELPRAVVYTEVLRLQKACTELQEQETARVHIADKFMEKLHEDCRAAERNPRQEEPRTDRDLKYIQLLEKELKERNASEEEAVNKYREKHQRLQGELGAADDLLSVDTTMVCRGTRPNPQPHHFHTMFY